MKNTFQFNLKSRVWGDEYLCNYTNILMYIVAQHVYTEHTTAALIPITWLSNLRSSDSSPREKGPAFTIDFLK